MVLDSAARLDLVFHALAHPARRAMLSQLSEGTRNLTELAAPLKMSFPAASKHFRVLERARLARRRVAGRTHICSIDGEPLKDVAAWMENYRRHWEASFDRLDEHLRQMQRKETGRDGA